MKKLFVGGIAFAALISGSAHAADMPVKAPLRTIAAAYNWTGFYVGATAGGAWGSFRPTTSTVNGPYFVDTDAPQVNSAGDQRIKRSGFTGGLEAGYNWQAGNIVYGFEGDIQSFRLKGSATSGPIEYLTAPGTTFTVTSNASTSWLATVRGRVGVAADKWLFFATGGVAFTTLKAGFAFSDTFQPDTEAVSISKTKTGYTVGGGVEAALWGRWSLKAEYLYVNFGAVSATGFLVVNNTTPMFHRIDLKANIARIGLNHRF